MADRTSAEVFGFILSTLASAPEPLDRKALAAEILHRSRHYDFSFSQMDLTDAECVTLGIIDPYPYHRD